MVIPPFPEFVPLSIDLKDEIRPRLSLTSDGVSEFTFGGLFLFRKLYRYRISKLMDKTLIISGIQPVSGKEEKAENFFMTPCAAPGRGILEELFKTHDFWKNIPESILISGKERLEGWGIEFAEDRNNFDYLYNRSDLARLSGKKYHKKRNLVTQFLKTYAYEVKPLSEELMGEAMNVLEIWRSDKTSPGDYEACREALLNFGNLDMSGLILYIEGKPAGWCLGEPVAGGRMFTVHFEKGLEYYKGIYQFINKALAETLPDFYTHINREQDLGEEGIRQAKMTYRPSGFVRKYTGRRKSTSCGKCGIAA